MADLGIIDGDHQIELPDLNNKGQSRKAYLFSEDKFGNIEIHYYQPNGTPYPIEIDGNKWDKSFTRTRLKEPIGDMKYRSPKGQGLNPWFTPKLIKKFVDKTPIDQLFLIEGEFKAFAADKIGADVIGLGSIHGFYAKKNDEYDPHVLHEDIKAILDNNEVKEIVLCFDADTLCINWKHDKDLFTRQNSFRKAVLNFYNVIQQYIDKDDYALESIYFCHLKSKFNDPSTKGLDDLIKTRKNEKKRILEDLKNTEKGNVNTSYFDFLKLDENAWTDTEDYFGLRNVEYFYNKYALDIGRKQFVYKNAKYVANKDGEISFIYHRDTENYFRIGTDWMKKIKVPNKFGDVDEKIVAFSIGEINRDYPEKKFPGFVSKIKTYDAYCNEPNWTHKYKREHSGCYNLSNPIAHNPSAGQCDLTLKFIKHIFSGDGNVIAYNPKNDELPKEFIIKDKAADNFGTYCKHYPINENLTYVETGKLGDQFTVGLDWLTIFHRYPKQMLPVPILVSKEYGTGKSTFFKWLKSIYGSNVAILNNEQFKMRFNAHYITKSLIIIDEGFLDVDKKAEKERLKQLVTSDTAYVEHKGVNLQEFPYYGKVMMGSNDADSVMKMDSDENRWFVVYVKPPLKKDKDPDLELKLKNEIPAFLSYLEKRNTTHDREQRLWFKEKYFITEQFKEIVKNTKTRLEKNIDELIIDMFVTYQVASIHLSNKTIVKLINEDSKYKCDVQDVKKYMKEGLKLKLKDAQRRQYPIGFMDDNSIQYSTTKYERCYEFLAEDWVNESHFDDQANFEVFKSNINPNKIEKSDLPFS